MKLLRVGEKGSEIVAALDKDQKIRNLFLVLRVKANLVGF